MLILRCIKIRYSILPIGDQRIDDDTTNSTCSLEDEVQLQGHSQNERLSKRKKKRYSSQVLMENWDYENMYPDTSNDITCNHCYPCSFFCKEVSDEFKLVLLYNSTLSDDHQG